MLVQVTTNNYVEGSEALKRRLEADLEAALRRFGEQLTRVEVHLSDVNSDKKATANDKHCVMEARMAGLDPIVAKAEAATIEEAIAGAMETLERTIDRTIDKRAHHKGRTSFGGDQTF
ncbi:MAG: HPF/RaiA family ribosome-associated protein [Isosphaeraceae bacterium]